MGAFHVQGEASQIVCATLNAKKGQKVVDVCAAPGGKSATVAQYMCNSGTLLSCDVAENRLPLIKDVFAKMQITCAKILQNDATVYNDKLENADIVLCDVPCSGLGILSKKPDIRLKKLTEIDVLKNIQLNIVKTCSKYVKSGGKLMYSTCTLNPDENENIVNEFLKNNSEFYLCEISDLPQNALSVNKCVTFYPSQYIQDGFFMALMQRR